MTRSDHARLLQRKAAQDLAVLDRLLDDPAIDNETLGYHAQQAAEKLIKALLALHGHDYPRSHNIGLLLDLLASHDIPLPERFEALQTLTPFGTVFRYDDLPLEEDTPDRRSWPPLLHDLQSCVTAAIEADERPGAEPRP
jgi:HEPN domain-containing protein